MGSSESEVLSREVSVCVVALETSQELRPLSGAAAVTRLSASITVASDRSSLLPASAPSTPNQHAAHMSASGYVTNRLSLCVNVQHSTRCRLVTGALLWRRTI